MSSAAAASSAVNGSSSSQTGAGQLKLRRASAARRRWPCESWQAPVWLLDEPFTALDAAAAELTRTLLGEHAQRGGSVVYSTHQDAGLRDSRVIEL